MKTAGTADIIVHGLKERRGAKKPVHFGDWPFISLKNYV